MQAKRDLQERKADDSQKEGRKKETQKQIQLIEKQLQELGAGALTAQLEDL